EIRCSLLSSGTGTSKTFKRSSQDTSRSRKAARRTTIPNSLETEMQFASMLKTRHVVSLDRFRPEPDLLDLRPGVHVEGDAFSLQPILKIGAVIDDVRLVNREHGVSTLAGLIRNVPVTEERDQLGSLGEDRFQPFTLPLVVCGFAAPRRPPNPVVHNVEPE